MDKADKIIGMLESIMGTLDEHSAKLDAHDKRFDALELRMDGLEHRFDGLEQRMDGLEHRFDGLEQRMDGLEHRFDAMEQRMDGLELRMDGFEQKLEMQSETLKEHGQILRALQSGQDHLKAEIDGMKISNAKEFGSLREALDDHSVKLELVREDTWANKVDIHRIKTTMGMK